MITRAEMLAVAAVAPDSRVAYGDHPAQHVTRFDARDPRFGAVVLHGGCWRDTIDGGHTSPLAAALAVEGFTTWNAEYRRLDGGGGYPETFDDVAVALDHVWDDARAVGLDPARIALVGHSAGGHLALWWAASRPEPQPRPAGVVALAAVCDLAASVDEQICAGIAARFFHDAPERLAEICPTRRLPIGVPHHHLVGASDQIVPPAHIERFVAQARAAGDETSLRVLPGGHFEPITPRGRFWTTLLETIRALASAGPSG